MAKEFLMKNSALIVSAALGGAVLFGGAALAQAPTPAVVQTPIDALGAGINAIVSIPVEIISVPINALTAPAPAPAPAPVVTGRSAAVVKY